MDVGETGLDGVDWIGLAQDRDRRRLPVNVVCERSSSIKCWGTIEWLHKWWPLEWYSAPQSWLDG
jgi:hypothetical protein